MDDPPLLSSEPKKERSRLARTWFRFGYGILSAGLILLAIWTFRHRNDAYFINYCTSAIPVLLTIVIAFVPDLRKAHMGWRIAIVGVGVLWSLLLWRQIDITAKQSTDDQAALLGSAAKNANNYSDGKFAGVQADVGKLGDKVETVNKQQVELAQAFSKATGEITTNLGKVGKPDPPQLAKLRVSLWKAGQSPENEPVESETIPGNADGSITVQFLIRNVSNTEAEESDLWVVLCTICSYIKEPEGAEKAPGTGEQERHFHVRGALNPGVAYKVFSVTFKSAPATSLYTIGFTDSCRNCGQMAPQIQYNVNVEFPGASRQ